MTTDVVDLRIYRSLGDLSCPRCRVGLRDAPTGPQCWKCLGTVGVKQLSDDLSPRVVTCPQCQGKMAIAGEDLICDNCFHVTFGTAEAVLPELMKQLGPCPRCGSKIVLINGQFFCAEEASLTCYSCRGVLTRVGGDLVCIECGQSSMPLQLN